MFGWGLPILKTIPDEHPRASIKLAYGSRSHMSIVFHDTENHSHCTKRWFRIVTKQNLFQEFDLGCICGEKGWKMWSSVWWKGINVTEMICYIVQGWRWWFCSGVRLSGESGWWVGFDPSVCWANAAWLGLWIRKFSTFCGIILSALQSALSAKCCTVFHLGLQKPVILVLLL